MPTSSRSRASSTHAWWPKGQAPATMVGEEEGEHMGYDAFISYSHAADGELAPSLQRGLQRLARPWYRVRSLRVFRDETGLSVNPHLWSSIEQALDDSRYLVLLASPEAAQSPWVGARGRPLARDEARRAHPAGADRGRAGLGCAGRWLRPRAIDGAAPEPRPGLLRGASAPRSPLGPHRDRPRPPQPPLPRGDRGPRRADPRRVEGRAGGRRHPPAPAGDPAGVGCRHAAAVRHPDRSGRGELRGQLRRPGPRPANGARWPSRPRPSATRRRPRNSGRSRWRTRAPPPASGPTPRPARTRRRRTPKRRSTSRPSRSRTPSWPRRTRTRRRPTARPPR